MVSFRCSRSGFEAIKTLARQRRQTRADVIRAALRYALTHEKEWT